MPPFRYHRPETVADCLALLGELGPDAKILAGGQSLLPVLALRLGHPDHLVDITRIRDLAGVGKPDARVLPVGATARQLDVEYSAATATAQPLLAAAMPYIGHLAVRSRGTVCGSLTHADPAAELPAVALALDAELVVQGPGGRRTVPAAEFFLGYLQSAVRPDELLVEARFPVAATGTGWSLREVSRRHGDFALAGVAATVSLDPGGTVRHAALACFGVAPTPWRDRAAESALVGELLSDDLIEEVATTVARSTTPPSDNHGSSAYRRHLLVGLLRAALTESGARAATSHPVAA